MRKRDRHRKAANADEPKRVKLTDPHSIYFPDAEHIAPFAIPFAQMMFAHARLEAEVRALQGAITGNPTFGEQPRNRFNDAKKRPAEMAKLINEHLGNDVEEAEQIVAILKDAIAPCHRRNLLAHGEWWFFDPRTSVITVRAGTLREDEEQHVDLTVSHITSLVETFETLNAELYKLRRSVETQWCNAVFPAAGVVDHAANSNSL